MKKLLIAAAVSSALITSSVYAEQKSFDGFVVGANIVKAKTDVKYSETGSSGFTDDDNSTDFEIYAGYGKSFDSIYISGELAYFKSSADVERVDILEIEDGFKLSARAGYIVNDSLMVYGRAGVIRVDMKSSLATSPITSHTENGYTLGAGVEYLLNENFSVLAEYQHSKIDSIGRINGVGGTIKVEPDYDSLNIGLAYRF